MSVWFIADGRKYACTKKVCNDISALGKWGLERQCANIFCFWDLTIAGYGVHLGTIPVKVQ